MRVALLWLLLFLAGCAGTGKGPPGQGDSLFGGPDPAQSREVHADLVREMIAQGRYHAALAHIEELQRQQGSRDELKLLHAETLSKLGRTAEAEKLYLGLLRGDYEGQARHGLGLLHMPRSRALGLEFLQAAARLRPTDADIRNDLGYALLLEGRHAEARLQLATAYELDVGSVRNRNNYLLVLLLLGDEREAGRVAALGQVPAGTLKSLRQQARDWPRKQQAAAPPRPATAPASRDNGAAAAAASARTPSRKAKPAAGSPAQP